MGDPTRTPITVARGDADMNRAAALAICARAHGKADAVLLLDACGLLAPGTFTPPKPRKARCRSCGNLATRCKCTRRP